MSKQGNNLKNSKINLKIHMESSSKEWTELYEKISEICDYAEENGVDETMKKFEEDRDATGAMLIYGSIEQERSGQS